MATLTPVFQSLVMGDRSAFPFAPYSGPAMDSTAPTPKVAAFMANLLQSGYAFTNADFLFALSADDLDEFEAQFTAAATSFVKEGFIFRKTFGESEQLTDYTEEEWLAILAQYSITYGWADEYEAQFFNISPVKVLDDYLGSVPTEAIDVSKHGTKLLTILFEGDVRNMIDDILESKSVLRRHQIRIVQEAPSEYVATSLTQTRVPIKETLVWAANLVIDQVMLRPILQSSTDILRFVVTNYVEEPIVGQLSKQALRPMKMHIPTRVRKFLLNNLELLGEAKGAKYLTEDMFLYSDFWKRLAKYLQFAKMSTTHRRYPEYGKAIDLLYEDDRSWTFNGRYSAAKTELDYSEAFIVAAERPGFLLRNLLEFMRMKKGTIIPRKVTASTLQVRRNPMQEMLSTSPDKHISNNVIKYDAFALIQSDTFGDVLAENANPKLLWQTLELLQDESIYLPYTSRTVQGVEVQYDGPMPGVDLQLGKHVRLTIKRLLREKLQARNSKLGKVYLDENLERFKLQYSGRGDTGINMSGQALVSGTELSISGLLGNSVAANPIIRLGVMWRSKEGGPRSVDLDHSLSVGARDVVYYGRPTMYDKKGDVCITSSGDIVSCGDSTFSTELVDIDTNRCRASDIMEMVSSVIVYHGGYTLSQYECYFFVNVIDAADRITGQKMWIDLQLTDYAVAIDPDGIDKSGGQLGFRIDLTKGTLEVLNLPLKSDGYSSSIVNNAAAIAKLVNSRPKRLNLLEVLSVAVASPQLVYDAENADTIVSQESFNDLSSEARILHPGRDMESIQKLLF